MALAPQPAIVRLPRRSLSLREQIEAMTNLEHHPPYAGHHTLLLPVGLHLVDEGEAMVWDRLELRPRPASSTRRCLWDFAGLAGADDTEMLRFVNRWGLLDWGEDHGMLDTDVEGSRALVEWDAAIETVSLWLRAFVLTEASGPLTAEEFWPLVYHLMLEMNIKGILGIPPEWQWLAGLGENDPARSVFPTDPAEWAGRADAFLDAIREAERNQWIARWQAERQAGTWLTAQRWLVSQVLNFWIEPYEGMVRTIWDDAGRRIEYTAYGVREIVGAHMAAIFAAPMADVYLCSMCGRAFELPDGEARRPREGARRFCGDACRLAARRESNRAAWHRHKDQWRRRGQDHEVGSDANADANLGG